VDRRELVRLFFLNAVCHDYENTDQIILPVVAEDGARCGLPIERVEVVDALAGMPDVSAPEQDFKTYFYVTEKGMAIHKSDDSWWPFDETDNLRRGWALDSRQ
jgi:hypothetical protein